MPLVRIIPDLTTPNPSAAANFVTLPDSWDTLLDETSSIPANYLPATPSIEFPGAAAAIGLTADYDGTVLGVPVYRAIFFDATGDRSHTRVLTGITNITNSVLTWNDPLPNGFTPATAWLQVQERHYSWLLTVRRGTHQTIRAQMANRARPVLMIMAIPLLMTTGSLAGPGRTTY